MDGAPLSNDQIGDPDAVEPVNTLEESSQSSATISNMVLKAILLGAAAGVVLPLIVIVLKIGGCHYGLAQINDIISAIGLCALPALIIGAGITAGAGSIGTSAGTRADAREGSHHRVRRAGWVGIGIGMFISLIASVVPALMLLFPDC